MGNTKRHHSKGPRGRWLLPLGILGVAVTAGIVLGALTADDDLRGGTPGAGKRAAPAAAPAPKAAPAAATAPAGASIARVRLDADGAPALGPADAPVTIVEFVDYQCPFCRRAHATVEQIIAKYGDQVQVVFLQNPLSFHKDAPLAAQAALAAAEQGKFSEYHARLLKGGSLKLPDLIAHATAVGLDVDAFKAALDEGRYADRVKKEQAQAARLGAVATPYFFVNGRPVRGAQPLATFAAIIDQELKGDLPPTRWVARAEQPRRSRPQEDPNKVWQVDENHSIARGPADAPITLVEFTAFQCGFCGRSQATLNQIWDSYPGKIRHLVKYSPMRGPQAAIASLAADRQGKYWEYRKLLFDNQRALSDANLLRYARQLSLDLPRFEKDLGDPSLAEWVNQNQRQAIAVGLRGTPTFFINGKKIVGAQPFASLKAEIDRQLSGAGQGPRVAR